MTLLRALAKPTGTALVVSGSRELAAPAPLDPRRAAYEGAHQAVAASKRTLERLQSTVRTHRDKIDGTAMRPAMLFGMVASMFGGPALGIVFSSVLTGCAGVIYGIRGGVGLHGILTRRVEGILSRGVRADSFAKDMALIPTEHPAGRALAAALAERLIADLNQSDVRGAGMRDHLYGFIDDPRITADDRAGATRILALFDAFVPPKEYDYIKARKILDAVHALTDEERAAVAPLATKLIFAFKKLPKGLSYEMYEHLQAALARRATKPE